MVYISSLIINILLKILLTFDKSNVNVDMNVGVAGCVNGAL
jgi:hypothetical protein